MEIYSKISDKIYKEGLSSKFDTIEKIMECVEG